MRLEMPRNRATFMRGAPEGVNSICYEDCLVRDAVWSIPLSAWEFPFGWEFIGKFLFFAVAICAELRRNLTPLAA